MYVYILCYMCVYFVALCVSRGREPDVLKESEVMKTARLFIFLYLFILLLLLLIQLGGIA